MREIPEAWRRFLEDGEWIREVPQAEGEYPITTLQGEPAGTAIVYCDPTTSEYKLARLWGGFFWSIPLPSMPSVPGDQVGSYEFPLPSVATGGTNITCRCGAIAPVGWNERLSCQAHGRFRK
jgi:hypothetical protein